MNEEAERTYDRYSILSDSYPFEFIITILFDLSLLYYLFEFIFSDIDLIFKQ